MDKEIVAFYKCVFTIGKQGHVAANQRVDNQGQLDDVDIAGPSGYVPDEDKDTDGVEPDVEYDELADMGHEYDDVHTDDGFQVSCS